ncbi:hypothetical protein DSM43276_01680 [Mycobacteroides salmoniphilum]|nr:hypothetical protein DSM43276_01680 [Mycobacteroides salmoniphilum]
MNASCQSTRDEKTPARDQIALALTLSGAGGLVSACAIPALLHPMGQTLDAWRPTVLGLLQPVLQQARGTEGRRGGGRRPPAAQSRCAGMTRRHSCPTSRDFSPNPQGPPLWKQKHRVDRPLSECNRCGVHRSWRQDPELALSGVQTSDPHEPSYIACQRIGKPGPDRPSALNHLQPVRSAMQLWLPQPWLGSADSLAHRPKLRCPAVSPETAASGHAELHSCSTGLATDT